MKLNHRPNLFPALLAMIVSHCGPVGNVTTTDPAGALTYVLDRAATNKLSNRLNLQIPSSSGYTFSIDGDNFDTSLAKKTHHEPTDVVTLTYKDVAAYDLQFRIYQSDGTVLIKDQITWEYSDEVPPEPDVIFSEDATSDSKVDLWASSKRGRNTKEIWVEGDVAEGQTGWHNIPATGTIPIVLTEADGTKNIRVHYRNIFGTEGSSVDLSILKKSVGPKNCKVSANSTVTATGYVQFEVSASNDGPLYYIAEGDVKATGKYTKFTDLATFNVELLGTDGANNVTIRVKDLASNYCPDQTFKLTYDPDHKSQDIKIKDEALWTDEPIVTVLPIIDSVPSDVIYMYISGDVVSDSNTMQWLPYSSSTTVQLNPVDGNRFVKVKYKVNGTVGEVQNVAIYLKPFVRVQGSSAPYTVVPSEFASLSSMTITGCTTAYNNIAFSSAISCTPNAANITATYYLTDGTSVARSVAAPP